MISISKCVVLAFATMGTALEVNFIRWSRDGCEDMHHIRKDAHVESDSCKTFSGEEPLFHSFMITPRDDADHLTDKYCQATIYGEAGCKGDGFTYGDMLDYTNICGNTTMGGRSVRVTCEPRTDNVFTSSLPASLTTLPSTVPSTTTQTITFSHVEPVVSTTTLILVPSPVRRSVCDDEADGEY